MPPLFVLLVLAIRDVTSIAGREDRSGADGKASPAPRADGRQLVSQLRPGLDRAAAADGQAGGS